MRFFKLMYSLAKSYAFHITVSKLGKQLDNTTPELAPVA